MPVFRIVALLALITLPAIVSAQQQPTAEEAAFIYELNRARQNPQRYDTEVSLGGILTGVIQRPPLVLNLNLVQSARFHTDEMATAPYYFAHQSAVTGDWPNKMARDAGYPLNSGLSNTTNNIESIAGGYPLDVQAALRLLIEDVGVTPPGHRNHLLATGSSASFYAQFREVGVGYTFNNSAPYKNYYAIHTGFRDSDPVLLTGFVYDDANSNGRYDQGEGLSGVTVAATGATTTSVQSTTGGMWMMQVSAGTVNLTCSGGSFSGTATRSVTVASTNQQIDFASGRSAGELDFEFQQVGGGPAVTISSSLSVFNAPTPGPGNPSAEQSYTVSGVRLLSNVTVTAPSQFQVSLTSGSGFAGSVQLTPSGGTLAATTVYVRFDPSGASGATGDITHASSGIVDSPVNVIGTVSTNPAVFCNPTSLNLTAPRLGVASGEQSYSVSGYNLTNNIVITAPSDFEVSQTSGSGFSGGLTLTQSGGTVAATTIYVRYVPTTLGASGNITNVSGATSQNVAVNGSVTNSPVITVNPSSLTLIAPSMGTPSAEQTFQVSGQYLGGDINLAAPTGFEFTLTSGSGYTTSINLTASAGIVGNTTVYVRFDGSTSTASGNIDCTSTLAATKQVALSGSIAPPPNLTVSTTSLTFSSQGTGVPSGERTFTVSGTNLVGTVTLTASTDFEISLTSGSGYGSSIPLTGTAGTLAATTIFARYVPSTTGTAFGTIDVSSPAATSRTINLTGSISTGSGGSGGGSDSGGGGCAASASSATWLLALLPLMALVAARRRRRA